MTMNKFISSYHNTALEQTGQMLSELGFSSIDELIGSVVPSDIKLRYNIELAKTGLSQHEFETHLRQLASKNTPLRSFIGMGYYQNQGSALLNSLIVNNPLWNNNIAGLGDMHKQGYLEALHNFQLMVCSMTGMSEAAHVGTDEAFAAIEAMKTMYELRSDDAVYNNHNILFVDQNIFAQTLDLLLTYSEPMGIEIVCDNFDEFEFSGKEFGAILQYPGANGRVCDYDDFCASAHSNSTLVAAAVDLMALAILKSPDSWGADIAFGSTQRLGSDLNFAASNAGFIATRKGLEGSLAKFAVHQTQDGGYKQDIGKVNHTIASPVMAIFAGLYAMLHGASGLYNKAIHAHSHAKALGNHLKDLGYTLACTEYFDTIEIEDVDAARISSETIKSGINIYCPDLETVHITLDELTTLDEINTLAEILAKLLGAKHRAIKSIDKDVSLLYDLQRTTPFMHEPIFTSHNSPREIESYIAKLERKGTGHLAGARDLTSLSSNEGCLAAPSFMPEFKNIHPFAPSEQTKGYTDIIAYLEQATCSLTALEACSFQPSSEFNALYSGFMIIRGYYQSKGQGHRNIVLCPSTTPQSRLDAASMAGMKIVKVNSSQTMGVDLKDFRQGVDEYSSELACLFIGYPNFGAPLENNIRQMIDIMHDNRAQVFIDGANTVGLIGLSSAGYLGADLTQINLHHIFNMPSYGGSAALMSLNVATHLKPLLPTHPLVATGGKQGITATSSAPYACALALPLAYAGFKCLKEQELQSNSKQALINTAYLAHHLKELYRITSPSQPQLSLELDNTTSTQVLEMLSEYGFYSSRYYEQSSTTLTIETLYGKAELDELINALTEIHNKIQIIKKQD